MTGAELIAAERQRQIEAEGFDAGHDDSHTDHELALAAACYAAPDLIYIGTSSRTEIRLLEAWPWESEWDKRDPAVRTWYPTPLGIALLNPSRSDLREKRLRELAKAGALIAAEIDRIQRVDASTQERAA